LNEEKLNKAFTQFVIKMKGEKETVDEQMRKVFKLALNQFFIINRIKETFDEKSCKQYCHRNSILEQQFSSKFKKGEIPENLICDNIEPIYAYIEEAFKRLKDECFGHQYHYEL
jgi:hypothetical protein